MRRTHSKQGEHEPKNMQTNRLRRTICHSAAHPNMSTVSDVQLSPTIVDLDDRSSESMVTLNNGITNLQDALQITRSKGLPSSVFKRQSKVGSGSFADARPQLKRQRVGESGNSRSEIRRYTRESPIENSCDYSLCPRQYNHQRADCGMAKRHAEVR